MKQLRYIVTVFFVLGMAFACKKEPATLRDSYKLSNSGTISAELNGNVWNWNFVETRISSNNSKRIYIQATILDNYGNIQTFTINNIDQFKEKQTIYNYKRRSDDTCTATYSTGNYDVAENGYDVLDSEDNYIIIDGYDPTSPHVRGSFQVTLYRLMTDIYPQTQGLPDTLRFTNGKFDVQIMKYD